MTASEDHSEAGTAAPALTGLALRRDFGAHLEANYRRLVAQLYAITLDPGAAHDAVQGAYSAAWRRWSQLHRDRDPAAWVRRVAVRSTMGGWNRVLGLIGRGRGPGPVPADVDERTRAVLRALARLGPAQRRAVVLHHMAGMRPASIAHLEKITTATVRRRLTEAEEVVAIGMADVLPEILGLTDEAVR